MRPEANKNEALVEEAKAQNAQANQEMKDARAASGVYGDTADLLTEAFQRSRQDSMKNGKAPGFDAWDQAISRVDGSNDGGDARAAIRYKKPGAMHVEKALACTDTKLRIELGDTMSGGRRKATLAIRVGSEGKRKEPVWARFKMVYHRALPPGAEIKRAWIQRRKIGMHSFRWELCISMESESFESPARLPAHTCSVNLAFRQQEKDQRLRAAYVVGTDGHSEAVLVPRSVRRALAHAEDLRGLRDVHLDAFKESLTTWIQKFPEKWQKLFTEERGRAVKWEDKRSHKWFSARVYTMRAQIGVSDPVVSEMVKWAKHDQHLGEWEARERKKALGRRREYYRMVARRLAKRYDRFVLDSTQLKEIAKRADPDKIETELEEQQRSQRFEAAPYTFNLAIALMASNLGSKVDKAEKAEKGKGRADTCHVCGKRVKCGSAQYHTCHGCNETWDVDYNHCRNLLGMPMAEAAE